MEPRPCAARRRGGRASHATSSCFASRWLPHRRNTAEHGSRRDPRQLSGEEELDAVLGGLSRIAYTSTHAIEKSPHRPTPHRPAEARAARRLAPIWMRSAESTMWRSPARCGTRSRPSSMPSSIATRSNVVLCSLPGGGAISYPSARHLILVPVRRSVSQRSPHS